MGDACLPGAEKFDDFSMSSPGIRDKVGIIPPGIGIFCLSHWQL